jgi:branched-chain amino acid transport system permease protein
MAFDVIAASYKERERQQSPLKRTVTAGFLFGGVALYFSMVGILAMFNERWIIADYLTLGQSVLLLIAFFAGVYVAYKATARDIRTIALQGLGCGAIAAGVLALLLAVMSLFDLRFIFIALKHPLFKMLSFGLGAPAGMAILVGGGALLGLLGALAYMSPRRIRRPLMLGFAAAGFVGLFQELLQLMLQYEGIVSEIRALLFTWDGLKLPAFIGIVAVVALLNALWARHHDQALDRFHRLPRKQQAGIRTVTIGIGLLVLLLFPIAAGNFIGQVLMMVGLFILMGMGLNLEIGHAGLLDLGFVAFYAVGAYTTALLTADSPHALAQLSYWQAMPIAILLSICVGVLFGVPVLKVRGDYLAVATLGLGEIVRVLVLSDMAAPLLAGAQGVLNVPRPVIAEFELDDPVDLFYLTLACSLVAAYRARLDRDPGRRGRGPGARHQPGQRQAPGLWPGRGLRGAGRLDLRGHAGLHLSALLPAHHLDQRARAHHRWRHGQPARRRRGRPRLDRIARAAARVRRVPFPVLRPGHRRHDAYQARGPLALRGTAPRAAARRRGPGGDRGGVARCDFGTCVERRWRQRKDLTCSANRSS